MALCSTQKLDFKSWVSIHVGLNQHTCQTINHASIIFPGTPWVFLIYVSLPKENIRFAQGPMVPPPWLNQGAAVNLAATGFHSQGGVPWHWKSRAIWLETDGNL